MLIFQRAFKIPSGIPNSQTFFFFSVILLLQELSNFYFLLSFYIYKIVLDSWVPAFTFWWIHTFWLFLIWFDYFIFTDVFQCVILVLWARNNARNYFRISSSTFLVITSRKSAWIFERKSFTYLFFAIQCDQAGIMLMKNQTHSEIYCSNNILKISICLNKTNMITNSLRMAYFSNLFSTILKKSFNLFTHLAWFVILVCSATRLLSKCHSFTVTTI